MKIAVFGTGYVGLVTGVCFAEIGNTVTCVDVDQSKVNMLKEGVSPIYEAGIEDILRRNIAEKRLTFTTDGNSALNSCDFIFIAVGTPPRDDGSADLSYVLGVAEQIGKSINGPKFVVTKSTVPVGTNRQIMEIIKKQLSSRGVEFAVEVISNPEFLREGCALEDCLNPDRIIVGVDGARSIKEMHRLYEPYIKNGSNLIEMSLESAELTKYASNAMLATKISFMNELSRLCEKVGGDIEKIREGIGADHRIGPHFIYAGVGYGGSCFPKDVKALIHTGESYGEELQILKAVEDVNFLQRKRFLDTVVEKVGIGMGKSIAVWGVAFKPGTDDIREAPAIYGIERLLEAGFNLQIYDPVASENVEKYFGYNKHVQFFSDQYDVMKGTSALCIFTEWKSFRNPDFARIKESMARPIIFDGRNIYDCGYMKEMKLEYYSVGR